ncbi:MAG: amidophosphoribosyltransferase [Chloroflexota bacterium]|jgi:amidophosphoribosyltransferase|nr:amidophosphoribosyltransferase [Chloroflexota bacterium]
MATADDRLHEACGVFGIYGPGEDVARLTFFGLYALQHRGQESAGIAAADGHDLKVFSDMGLVSQVFSEDDLTALQGHIAIGHTRYSTTGSSCVENAQPILVGGDLGPMALAHNGNLVNTQYLRSRLLERGELTESTTTDSESVARLCATAPGRDWVERIRHTMPIVKGAYSMVMLTPRELIAVRDPYGIRPLCFGRLGDSWIVASESCALDTIGAELLREVLPGEMLIIDEHGPRSESIDREGAHDAMCIFEYIYFAGAASVINDTLVYLARERIGAELAREYPVDADLVMPVPDSAIPAAIGYARESGLPFQEGLIKNRYIGRTFIQPDQRLREAGVALKFNALPEVLEGKRVVVIDDSIVRGTTTPKIVEMLRRAGAREVHVRISAPPMINPCYLGIDTARREELIAANMDVPSICRHIDADSLGYLSLDGLVAAIGLPKNRFCHACFTGEYPMPVQLDLDLVAR